jgi:hypothetical protein
VFYWVIDWLAEHILNASPALRWLNAVSLDVISLGHVRRYVRRTRRQSVNDESPVDSELDLEGSPTLIETPIETNGNGHAHAADSTVDLSEVEAQ